MARVRIAIPVTFRFSTLIPVRITDLNYGGHVGNDSILSLFHEARLQYLQNAGYSELNLGGPGLIMADAALEFKAELFYGEELRAWVAAAEFSRAGFTLYYKLEKQVAGKNILVALGKTGMICYDYTTRKIAALPNEVMQKLENS